MKKEINWDTDINWGRVPENTMVKAWNDEDLLDDGNIDSHIMYFCRKENEIYYVFDNNGTSFSEDFLDVLYSFKYCKLVRREDIKKYKK